MRAWLLLLLLAAGCASAPPPATPSPTPAGAAPEASAPASEACPRCGERATGQVILYEQRRYHPGCYAEVGPRCGICDEVLMGAAIRMGPGPAYHELCISRATRCWACSLPTTGWRGPPRRLNDGRELCGSCGREAVFKDPRDAEREARARLGRLGISPRAAPLRLVSDAELARVADRPRGQARGYTVARRPSSDVPWEVTVYAIEGLPREALVGVLAHELFHVWQLDRCEDLEAAWREGSANYVQWLVLTRAGATLWSELLEVDSDPVYGEGFRRFRRWVGARPPRAWLQDFVNHRDFPGDRGG